MSHGRGRKHGKEQEGGGGSGALANCVVLVAIVLWIPGAFLALLWFAFGSEMFSTARISTPPLSARRAFPLGTVRRNSSAKDTLIQGREQFRAKQAVDQQAKHPWSAHSRERMCAAPGVAKVRTEPMQLYGRGGPRCGHYQHIFDLGIGKSGTTSVNHFFFALGYNLCKSEYLLLMRAGCDQKALMEYAVQQCSLHTEMNSMYGEWSFMPIWSDLLNFAKSMTPLRTLFVLPVRTPSSWLASVKAWSDLRLRFTYRKVPGLQNGGSDDAELMRWYHDSNELFRFLFRDREDFIFLNMSSAGEAQAALQRKCGTNITLVRANHNKASRSSD
jgi:hypothetical protein